MKSKPRYQPGDKIGGRYQVHQVKMGGMGEVYLCLDLKGMYPYALKTFQQRYLTKAQKLRTAFEQEVATWVALEKHPNIVRCFYMDILDNQPFMVLEWIAGEEGKGTDLHGWLRHGPLDLRLALDFTIDICRGLIHAQEKQPGLVHRDLKPENILIAQGGLAKITDFGLAEIVQEAGLELDIVTDAVETDGRQSIVGRKGIAGTPAYMAPEQWRGEALDERTDIYALGCMLYEMLTGEWPFQVDFVPSTLQQFQQWLRAMQAAHETGRLPTLPSNLLAALGDLLQSCLAKTQAERPASLTDLLAQLTSLYRQQFDQAPPSRPEPGEFTAIEYNNRGFTYYRLKQYNKALDDFNRAIHLDPTWAKACNNRGLAYHELQRYEEALTDFNRTVELDPSLAGAYTNRGLTYDKLERYEQALADHNYAIQLYPTLAQAHFNRGVVNTNLRRYEEALTDYTRAIQLDSTLPQVYYNRGNMYHNLLRYMEALADYTQAIQLDPADAKAYYNRGVTYRDLRRYDAALADFEQATQLDPNYAAAYFNIGAILGNNARWHEALPYFEKAGQLGMPQGVQYAAQARQFLGLEKFDKADSINELQQAVVEFPYMIDTNFITAIEQTIAQQAPSHLKPILEQRLSWLHQIANEQEQKEQNQ